MLLFVMEAEFDERAQLCRETCHRIGHRTVDMGAIGHHFCKRRAGQQTPLRPGMPRSFGFIIAVEQIGVGLVKQAIAGNMIAQQKSFKKPAGVGEMPFCRRSIVHRLRGCIGIAQTVGEMRRMVPHMPETMQQVAR